ncbi:MAG: DinB family protein [Thermoanaerobaculia bacterium]
MNRRELETLFLTLESTPALLARAASGLSDAQTRRSPKNGRFSFIEHVWHLADLEREGYGVRIRRLLTEEDPMLSNFDGDRVMRERVYSKRDLAEGLTAFARARHANLEQLRGLSAEDWKRRGDQEEVGRVDLSDIPRMMTEHDRAHTAELADLIAELTGVERQTPQQHPRSAVA